MDAAAEEGRELARTAFPHQHFHDFVSTAAQDSFKCDGLGQVSSALPLDDKQVFHEAETIVGTMLSADGVSSNSTSA